MAEVRSDAQVHLICGATGAGKSTYAEALAVRVNGLRFSIDEWLGRLFLPDGSLDRDFSWFLERVRRCGEQMREVADRAAPLGVPSIFDVGLTNREERGIFADWATARGYATQLHWIDVDAETRWSRVQKRNAERAETFVFNVDRGMFDFIEGIWEAPGDDEMAALGGLRTR